MSDLEATRDHARAMAVAEHKPECHGWRATWSAWGPSKIHPDPACGGCMPERDKDLFRRIADEIDAYLTSDDEDQEALL